MHTISQHSAENNKNNQSLVAASSYCLSPEKSRASAPGETHPYPTTYSIYPVRARRSPQEGAGMFNARRIEQRKARRSAYGVINQKEGEGKGNGQGGKNKTEEEWEKGPEEDKIFGALTQTGEERTEDVEMTQAEERATAVWMEEGRKLLIEGRQDFTFLGKEGRKEKELVLSAVHSHTCKWDAQTMNLPPIDIGVPEEQKYRALRTQVTQQVERLGCKCYIAFEERRMREWLEKRSKEERQAWVVVMDSEDPRPSEEKIISIFFTKHDQDCKWKGKGEMRLNPIRTEKKRRRIEEGGSEKNERRNRGTRVQV